MIIIVKRGFDSLAIRMTTDLPKTHQQDQQIAPLRPKRRENGPYSNWVLSLAGMIVVPCFPIFIELARNEWCAKSETYYLTGAVLAATYLLSSLHNSFRGLYICLFVGMIALDFQPVREQCSLTGWAFWLLIGVAVTQAIERFDWHVNQNRLFPDWLEGE